MPNVPSKQHFPLRHWGNTKFWVTYTAFSTWWKFEKFPCARYKHAEADITEISTCATLFPPIAKPHRFRAPRVRVGFSCQIAQITDCPRPWLKETHGAARGTCTTKNVTDCKNRELNVFMRSLRRYENLSPLIGPTLYLFAAFAAFAGLALSLCRSGFVLSIKKRPIVLLLMSWRGARSETNNRLRADIENSYSFGF